jgi:hypothetical protein
MPSTTPEQDVTAVEWRDDARPFIMCMVCAEEFPDSQTTCPKCHVALSQVHRCPQCTRIVSIKHLRCPYCTRLFVKGNELEKEPDPAALAAAYALTKSQVQRREQHKQKKVMFFSILVFLAVFSTVTLLIHVRSRSVGPAVMGTSYVLYPVELRQSPNGPVVSSNKLAAGSIVQITGVQQDGQGENWFQIAQDNSPAYVRVTDLAPPKGNNAESGYTLLKVSLLGLDNPQEADDAAKAVDLYRRLYSFDPRGEELLWILAARQRELGIRSHSQQLLTTSRKNYEELAAGNGEYSSRSKDSLRHFSEHSAAVPHAAPPPIEVIGATNVGTWKVADSSHAQPHKLMLLNQTKVLVKLSGTQAIQAGELLTGQIASNIIAGNEVVVPAGSGCKVKVISMSDNRLGLQLQSMQIADRSYSVDAAPIQLSLRDLTAKSGAPVLFRLRRSLVLYR